MEGVLTPEIWIALAEKTGIDELRRTTRDEPDYQKLMAGRIALLDANGIGLSQISEVVATLDLLEGARAFLDELRQRHPVVILSDTYEQLAGPLFAKLGQPLVLCHRLEVTNDRITGTEVRIPSAKKRAVESYCAMGYTVASVGDSFNDLEMLRTAHHGMLFHAPASIREANSDLPACDTYDELTVWINSLSI